MSTTNDNSNNFFIVKDDFKRVRKCNAIELPVDISENMIPKYVVYYKECYNKEKLLFREFFKIEKHPKLINYKKHLTSSKSKKITIVEKLEQIKLILKKIENDELFKIENGEKIEENGEKIEENGEKIEENGEKNEENGEKIEENGEKKERNGEKNEENGVKKKEIILPKYISLKNHEKDNKKYYLIYDEKTNKYRNTYKLLYYKNIEFSQNLKDFLEKVREKFEK
jgi:hypothetical protein